MQTKQGIYPLDARIFIDYKTKNVKFEYVEKTNRMIFISLLFFYTLIWYVVLIVSVLIFSWFYIPIIQNLYLSNSGFSFAVSLGKEWGSLIFLFIKQILIMFSIIFLPPILMTSIIYWTKQYPKIIPKFTYQLASLGGRKYFKKIWTTLALPYCELSLFKNVHLKYKTEGQFSDFLDRIEIKEIEGIQNISKKGLKSKPSYRFWKAQFFFSEIPKTGKLEVDFI